MADQIDLSRLESSLRKAARNVIFTIIASSFAMMMVVQFYSQRLDETGVLQGMLRSQVDVNLAMKRMGSEILPLVEAARIRNDDQNESLSEALGMIEAAVQDLIDEKYGTILSSRTIIYSNEPGYDRVARAQR